MLQGMVTERDLPAIEDAFPGISRYYEGLIDKPRTCLELVWRYVTGGLAAVPRGHSATLPGGQ